MYKSIILVVLLLVVALVVQLRQQGQTRARIALQQRDAEKLHSEELARGTVSGTPGAETLVPESFTVPDGPPKEFPITVDTSMKDVTVTGRFDVSDHSHKVEVYIFDEDDYTNWMYGNNAVAV